VPSQSIHVSVHFCKGEAVKAADPDLVMHLAAESHVDRSIS
jgi:dTDP-D-glucose 4,6-dehydratase